MDIVTNLSQLYDFEETPEFITGCYSYELKDLGLIFTDNLYPNIISALDTGLYYDIYGFNNEEMIYYEQFYHENSVIIHYREKCDGFLINKHLFYNPEILKYSSPLSIIAFFSQKPYYLTESRGQFE